MKKIYLSILISIITVAAMAQLQNSSFENWTTTSFDEPTNWQTGNRDNSNSGLVPVTRVSGPNGYAVRMETMVSNGGDTAQAYIANGDPMQGTGGIPIPGSPTAFTGQYRYSLPNNDSALILLIFKSNGVVFDQAIFKIKGTGTQNTFTNFSFPLNLPSTPDSVIIAAASSNLIDNVGVENGSFMELDNIAFSGINATIDNADFENWSTQSFYSINSWETYGEGVTRTTDSHDGMYAISLASIDYGNGDFGASGMTSGHNSQNGSTGGTPFTSQSDTITGWYKYTSPCSDTGYCWASVSANGNNVGGGSYAFTQTTQWTYFELPVWTNSNPDTLRIDFSSSTWPYTNACDGSTLIIDQVALKSEILAGVKNTKSQRPVFAYPNPATSVIHINSGNRMQEDATIEVYDVSGRQVMTENKKTNSDDAINISILQSGRYYYRLASSRGDSMNSFTKQ